MLTDREGTSYIYEPSWIAIEVILLPGKTRRHGLRRLPMLERFSKKFVTSSR